MKAEEQVQILVVEDSSTVAVSIKDLLEDEFDAKVDIAGSCAAARERLENERYDVVALDYRLPDGHGHELLQTITMDAEHPPVIMVTGHGDEQIAAYDERPQFLRSLHNSSQRGRAALASNSSIGMM